MPTSAVPQKRDEALATEELRLLFSISQRLDHSGHLESTIQPVLNELGKYLGFARIALSLLDHETGKITIQENHGLTDGQVRLGSYDMGEGVTGAVFKSGEPQMIANINEDDKFLNRTLSQGLPPDEGLSFICVPVRLEAEVIGTLGVLRPTVSHERLEEDMRLISILASLIAKAVDIRRIIQAEVAEKERLRGELKQIYQPKNIVGRSKKMQEVYRQIEQVSGSDATVLLLGESGVGKELVAHAIHYSSERENRPFVRVNCAALPESVIESELFGHEKGAFTGALKKRMGRFEQANGGTLFLDEIGDFSPAIQVALLRVLQEKEIERVGGSQTIKLDVRIIAATNRDLSKQMQEGSFRADLFYRLNVFPIRIPSLRDRKEDVPLLADAFVRKYKNHQKDIRRISTSAINALLSYSWPGNVRELENVIERALLVARGGVLRVSDLPPTLQTASTSNTGNKDKLEVAMENLMRELITDALIESRGNMARASRMLGITERVMGIRVKKLGLDARSFKTA